MFEAEGALGFIDYEESVGGEASEDGGIGEDADEAAGGEFPEGDGVIHQRSGEPLSGGFCHQSADADGVVDGFQGGPIATDLVVEDIPFDAAEVGFAGSGYLTLEGGTGASEVTGGMGQLGDGDIGSVEGASGVFIGPMEHLGAPGQDKGEGGGGGGDEDGGGGDQAEAATDAFVEGDGTTGLDEFEVAGQVVGGGVALMGLGLAGAEDDGVEFADEGGVAAFDDRGWNGGEFEAVEAGEHFVHQLAQAIEIGGGGTGAFGGNVAMGAHRSEGGVGSGHQADVGQFGHALDENDVGRFDIAMDEAFVVEDGEGAGEVEGDLDTIGGGESASTVEQFLEGEWDVGIGVDGGTGDGIVGGFHDIIEIAGFLVTTDVEEGELTGATGGDGLEAADALEFASEGAVVIEAVAVDDFDDAEDAGDGAGEPDFAVAPAANGFEELVIGDAWWLGVGGRRGGHCVWRRFSRELISWRS